MIVLAYSLNLVQLQHFFTSFWRQRSLCNLKTMLPLRPLRSQLVLIILANVSHTDPDPEDKRLGGLLSHLFFPLHHQIHLFGYTNTLDSTNCHYYHHPCSSS